MSRLMVTEAVLVPPALVEAQVIVMPDVSLVTFVGPQPCDEPMADSASVTFQVTDTFERNQPLAPEVPLTTGVMMGAVESPCGAP